ncbi:MAG: Uma2 family endonuclease [Chloroflexota bacterium]|nr:Uma2 family endonuclease [Chloroflexota bacterium]
MITKTEATAEDLYDVPEDGKAEIVNGKVVVISPTGRLPNRAASKIWLSLYQYEQKRRTGFAVTDNASFTVDLPNRKSFSPDAAFFIGEDPGMGFFEGAPIFAAEVRSENDYGAAAEQAIEEKRQDYFAAGTLVVWDVDLLSKDVVRVYRSDEPKSPTIYRRGEEAEAEPALPGWSMPVDDLFI